MNAAERYRQNQLQRGLVKVAVWVPRGERERVMRYAKRIRDAKRREDKAK